MFLIKKKPQGFRRRKRSYRTAIIGIGFIFISFYFAKQYSNNDLIFKSNPQIKTTNIKKDKNIGAINKLTKQLLIEQKKSLSLKQKLNNKNQELNLLIEQAITKTTSQDKRYLLELKKAIQQNTQLTNRNTLNKTDYHNKIKIGPTPKNALQISVNKFMTKNSQSKKESELNYAKNLAIESNIRNNETRTIVLKKGETLWKLAKRAYGKGYLYKKILNANPQITEKNVRILQPGTTIRVPF